MSVPGGGNWKFSTGAALMGQLKRAHVGARGELSSWKRGATGNERFSFINYILTVLSLDFESRLSRDQVQPFNYSLWAVFSFGV